MSGWVHTFWEVVRFLLGNPNTGVEFGVVLTLSMFVCVVTVSKVGGVMGVANTGLVGTLLSVLLAVCVSVVAAVAVKLLIVPVFDFPGGPRVLLIVTSVAALLVFGLPLYCIFQRSSYFVGIAVWVIGLVATALVVVLCHTVVDAVQAGGQVSRKVMQHKESTEEF